MPGDHVVQPAGPLYRTRLARTVRDRAAVARLRYDVFVCELGADGPMVDHGAGSERDRFDPFARHLMLEDLRGGTPRLVGCCRMIQRAGARRAGGFYSAAEFDLGAILETGRPVLELGRTCLAPDHRGGAALMYLWAGLSELIEEQGIGLVFGVASLPGTVTDHLSGPLSLLHHLYRTDAALRPVSRQPSAFAPRPLGDIDRRAAMLQMPALLKAYLRLGGRVGDGVFVDQDFNCTDVCMVLDAAAISARARLPRTA